MASADDPRNGSKSTLGPLGTSYLSKDVVRERNFNGTIWDTSVKIEET